MSWYPDQSIPYNSNELHQPNKTLVAKIHENISVIINIIVLIIKIENNDKDK